jgi:TolB-like protein/Tfp pilus assembly protein PilF
MRLFSEIKRRNVHRMAVLYGVTTWLIMQAAEVVMTLAALPEWTGRLTLLLLALGFPVALVLSWFYELTPEGISLEKDVETSESITHVTGRRLDFVVIALLCAAVLVFAYDKWWVSGSPVTSIAVLPLDEFGADVGQQYLADSMTDVLTAELGQIKGLRVMSRTSAMRYKDTEKLLPAIAKELGVDAIVEGSIQPVGDAVRFTMQLIDGRTDRHLWARSYHRDLGDILTLQGEIARAIADEIHVVLTPQTEARFARERRTDSETARSWAVGNFYLKGSDEASFNKGLQAFIEASNRDPEFAPAYAGIAQAYLLLGSWSSSLDPASVMPLAKMAAEKAIQLDPDFSEAHFALAMIYRNDWQWQAAEQEFRIGRDLNPSDSVGLMEYANFLTSMGRADEAIEVGRQAVEVDPVSPMVYNELAFAFYSDGRYDEALEIYKKALKLDPGHIVTHILLTQLYWKTGEQDKARPHFQKWTEDLESLPAGDLGMIGTHFAELGRTEEARKYLALLHKRAATRYVPSSAFASVYLALKEYDEAIRWFQAAHHERDLTLVWHRDESAYPEALRDDPRIQAIIQDMAYSEQ